MKTSAKAKEQIIIALDAMGGDNAPDSVVNGAEIIAKELGSNIFFKIFGPITVLKSLVEQHPNLLKVSEIIHSEQIVTPDDLPSRAVRNLKESSMQLAINAVKDKSVDAAVSGGNTGVLMAMSVLTLRTLNGVHRPAIVTLMPTIKKMITVLDLGANIKADAANLYEFAVMGASFAKIMMNKEKPTVGLLNVGSEEHKGMEYIKEAYYNLKNSELDMNFIGYVEGDDIAKGSADVIVTDGFTGNVVLKAIQGYIKLSKHFISKHFRKTWLSKLKYLIVSSVFKDIAKELDPRDYNGAMLIGLNGIIVKSHGSSDEVSYASAIRVAYNLSRNYINDKISQEIKVSIEKVKLKDHA